MKIKRLTNKNLPTKVFHFKEDMVNTDMLDKLKELLKTGELSFKEIKAIGVKLDSSNRGFWIEYDNDSQYLMKVELIEIYDNDKQDN